jgi:hypothetical protein
MVNVRTFDTIESYQVFHAPCSVFTQLSATLSNERGSMSATGSEQIIRIKYTNSMLTEETRFRETTLLTTERAFDAHEHFVVLYFYFTHVPFHDKDTYFRLQLRRKPCCAAPIVHP